MKETVLVFLKTLGILTLSAAALGLVIYLSTWLATFYLWILQYSSFWAGVFILVILLLVVTTIITLIVQPWRINN